MAALAAPSTIGPAKRHSLRRKGLIFELVGDLDVESRSAFYF